MEFIAPPGIPAPQNPYYYPHPPQILSAAAPPPVAVTQIPPHLAQPYHQPPFGSYAPSLQPIQASGDELRTLFIAGLPEDTQPREIYNLFREFPGYESSHMRRPAPGSQPFAFAVFVDQRSAIAALHAVNGMVFDIENGSTLHVDLAKSNSRSKRSRIEDGRSDIDKKVKGPSLYSGNPPDSGVGGIHMSGMVNSLYDTIGFPSTQSSENFDGYAFAKKSTSKLNSGEQNVDPCPTLFVANLGPSCSEQELNQLFSRCPGFLKLKLQSTYGTPVAFVDFQDASCSTGALNYLQGAILPSSPEGVFLEYAKSRMGMRRKERR